MKRLKSKRLFVFVMAGIFLAISALRVGSQRASASQLNIRARSLLPKLPVTSVTPVGDRTVEVWFRNDYDKDITAVVFSVGPAEYVRRDYVYAGLAPHQKLAPGATDYLLHTPNLLSKEIVIIAALFRDMTRDGDADEIRAVLDKRRGVKTQLARINPHIEVLGAAQPSTMLKEIQRIQQVAANLPIATDDGAPLSEDLDYGLKHGRDLILHYLSKLEGEFRDERVETHYLRDGTPFVVTRDDRFPGSLTDIRGYLTGLEARL